MCFSSSQVSILHLQKDVLILSSFGCFRGRILIFLYIFFFFAIHLTNVFNMLFPCIQVFLQKKTSVSGQQLGLWLLTDLLFSLFGGSYITPFRGAGIAQWLERRTRDWKVAGSNPCWNGGRIFFSRVDFLCWLLFRYPFHPRVTTVARKRSRSFCQKCRWQVTAKHAYTLRMWLCMKWHGAWLYGVHRTCAETAAVSCGTSHASAVSTPLRWILKKKTRYKS